MRCISIYPNQILIIEQGLEHTIKNEFYKLKDYFDKEFDKKVIASMYNNHYIVLDGNKLCAVNRILNKNTDVVVLEDQDDFINFHSCYSREVYTSCLLDFKKWSQLQDELDFFVEFHKSIDMRDFFYNLNNQDTFIEQIINYGYKINSSNLTYIPSNSVNI